MIAPLLTVPELAKQLAIAERTLEQWRQAKRGPVYVRLGRAIRYRQSDVDAWLSKRAVESAK